MAAPVKPNYTYSGAFDRALFQREFVSQFAKSGRYNPAAMPQLLALLGSIERDPAMLDIRWAAYMLATVMWETTYPTKTQRPALGKKGKPLVDKKGVAIMIKETKWLMTMRPVDEIGHGKTRDYHEAVKVIRLADGSVHVTEQDGDQFIVTAAGTFTVLTKGTKVAFPKAHVGNKFEGGGVPGTKDGGVATATYDSDAGTEQAFYGRGYVQLTWWSNYAKAGASIGRGLDLLLDPELVKDANVAYALMSHGMRTGDGFANGHKFSNYFFGSTTHYVGARHMVNGKDHAGDIAAIAEKFEALLLKAKLVQSPSP